MYDALLYYLSRKRPLRKFLEEELRDIDPDFQFHYSQWQTTETAYLVTVISTCEEYKETLTSAINAITIHVLLAKCLANFLRAKKESLKANEMIVLGDFAENYQLICVIISKTSIWMSNGYSLQLVLASQHVMVMGDFLNVTQQNVVYKEPYMTKF